MKIEIQFPATDAPKYLDMLHFTREGANIIVQVVHSERNVEKARYEIDVRHFIQMLKILVPEAPL